MQLYSLYDNSVPFETDLKKSNKESFWNVLMVSFFFCKWNCCINIHQIPNMIALHIQSVLLFFQNV